MECYNHSCPIHDPSTPYCTQDYCIETCPHCGRRDYVPKNILQDVIGLGSVEIKYRCVHCDQVIQSVIKRTVIAKIMSSSKL